MISEGQALLMFILPNELRLLQNLNQVGRSERYFQASASYDIRITSKT